MSNPNEFHDDPEHLFIARYTEPNMSVWESPYSIGELEFFAAFRLVINSQQRPARLAVSVPEFLLLDAGIEIPQASDESLRQEMRKFPAVTQSSRTVELPRTEAAIHPTDAVDQDSFLGAAVEAKTYEFSDYRTLGRHTVQIADYVRDTIWHNPELVKRVSYHGFHPIDFAANIAQTVQQAVED